MTLRFLFFLSPLMGCLLAQNAWAQTITGKVIPAIPAALFSNELRDMQIIVLDSRKLLQYAQEGREIRFKPTDAQDWLLQLTPDPVFAPDYTLMTATERGVQRASSHGVLTYSGRIRGTASGTCRLTLADDFIYGVFEVEGEVYFIEPARRLNQSLGKDQYLWYESAAILPNENGRCAGALYQDKAAILYDVEKSQRQCYTVEMAIAADYKMYELLGSHVPTLEKYVAAILNSVRANYDDEFTHEIRFEIATFWVSTCTSCDPWGTDTNYENLLANFRDWGNDNGFTRGFDIANLWTGRALDDNIGGGGYYGALCGRLRYNVLRRYSENAGLMRALQAHELGHNLNARHDSTSMLTIMSPLIRDVTEWSAFSKISINNYFNVALGLPDCVNECQAASPVADFFALQSKGCAPLTVQFYNTSSANATEWNWIFEGGNPATSNAANPLVTYAEAGTYSVTLQAKNAYGNQQLAKTTFVEVKGPPEPIIAIEYQMGATQARFSTLAIADSVRWEWGDGNTSRQPSVLFDFQQDGNYPITLVTYNECGADTAVKMVNIVTPPQAGFSAANFVGCAPLTVQFQNESSANAVEFQWQFNGGTPATSTERHPTVAFEKPGVYSITLVARNAAGEVTKRVNNLIQVNDVPSAGFSASATNNKISFRNLSQTANAFQWSFGDGNTSTTLNPVHTYTQSGTFQVQLIAQNDCGSDTITKPVEIIGLPPAGAFMADVQEGCVPFTVAFMDQSNNEPEAWEWQFEGGTPAVSEAQHPVVQYTQPGTYAVRLITRNFFGADTLTLNHYIQVAEQPSADFSWTMENLQVTFHLAGVVQRGWEYTWHFGDGNISLQPEPEYFYQNPGNYAVELIVSNECGSDTIRKMVQIGTTPVEKVVELEEIRLYPNPTEGRFFVYLSGTPKKWLKLRFMNVLGQEMHRQEVDFSTGNWQQYFDFQYFASGAYWLEVQSDTGMIKKSFIIQSP